MSTIGGFEMQYWDWARVSHVYSYHKERVHGAEWGIKGHNRPWVTKHGQWKAGIKFLDIGAGFSDLPSYLVERYGMEGWVADDFGMSAGETLWSRWGDPRELPKKYPKVKYVFKCVGQSDAWDQFPKAYFDRIYSISTLEHVPKPDLPGVFSHMVAMLKPGGIMLHTIDIPFDISFERLIPSHSGKYPLLEGILSLLWQLAGDWNITKMCLGSKYYPVTSSGWAHFIKKHLPVTSGRENIKSTSFLSLVLDKDILIEPINIVYHFYPPNEAPKRYRRNASLLLKLKLISG